MKNPTVISLVDGDVVRKFRSTMQFSAMIDEYKVAMHQKTPLRFFYEQAAGNYGFTAIPYEMLARCPVNISSLQE